MTDPLVLLPGMMCDARLFLPQIIALSSEFSVQVAPITQGDTVEEIARNVAAALPDRCALAGLSMGGIVAMEVLRIAPARISRLALMDTNCQAEMPNVAAAREPQIVGARAGRLAEIMRDEMKPNYLAPGSGRIEVLNTVMDMALDLGPDVFVRQSRALQRRPDQQSTLRKSKTPALIVCGEHDTLCPIRRHEFMAHLMPNARLEIIDDAGHLPPLEQPGRVTDLLRGWLLSPQ
ncbi:MAG: alpha/beta hydrolase [Rhodobacter sp.]|nr:alpha/beta hydrolase [Rhodobacter sp.]